MSRQFDAEYWERRYRESPGEPSVNAEPPEPADHADEDATTQRAAGQANPHLVREVSALTPGRALDAGCGTGIETAWLAEQGWRVTGVDISRTALDRAERIMRARGVDPRVHLIAADLTTWAPEGPYNLVTTHYAHPTIAQLQFYRRVAGWVAVGGTLLIIGHLHHHPPGGTKSAAEHHGSHGPPEEAEVRAADVVALLAGDAWRIETAEETTRSLRRGEDLVTLHDVVVRATRTA